MNAMDRGRKVAFCLVAAAFAGTIPAFSAWAQFPKIGGRQAPAPAAKPAPSETPGEGPILKEMRVPTNPTDSIAIVNGEIITRQQLADECVARKGQEILETLIARRLIEQVMRAQKMEVTASEIDAEIDSIAARTAQVTREIWLRTLEKDRGISPAQYARDIIYPALALRKLAEKRVQVTEQDIKDAFEANYGIKMKCRIIMCKDIRSANEIWEELRKNPAGFESIAKTRSLDAGTRALGGMLPEPIARHAYPRTVSDAAYSQLVDGDPKDTNPAHKPKDGDFTGPIQVTESSWVIMKREEISPGNKAANPSDPKIRTDLRAQMFEVKLNDAMTSLFEDIMRGSAIENKLTGQVKIAHEEHHKDFKTTLDGNVKLMNDAGQTQVTSPSGNRNTGSSATATNSTRLPAGVPSDAAKTAGQLQQTIKAAPPGTAPRNN